MKAQKLSKFQNFLMKLGYKFDTRIDRNNQKRIVLFYRKIFKFGKTTKTFQGYHQRFEIVFYHYFKAFAFGANINYNEAYCDTYIGLWAGITFRLWLTPKTIVYQIERHKANEIGKTENSRFIRRSK